MASCYGRNKRRLLPLATAALLCLSALTYAAPAAPPPDLAGRELGRNRDAARQKQLERQMENDQTARQQGGVEYERPDETRQDEAEVRFELKQIVFSASEVLTTEELAALARPYLGRETTLREVQKLLDEINARYEAEGYVTARALLTPQTIESGVLNILLVEGKVGHVAVKGASSTDEIYITRRLPLTPGTLSSVHALNQAVLRFNGTNDVQLRVLLKAGKQPGTTDYEITAFEPPREQTALFADTAGAKETGAWRSGLSYTQNSLTGQRDTLNVFSLFSEGTWSGAFSYATPIDLTGTRLSFGYSKNGAEIISGALRSIDVKSNSDRWYIELNRPFSVAETQKFEGFFSLQRQRSHSDMAGFRYYDRTSESWSGGLALTNYGAQWSSYCRAALTSGSSDSEQRSDGSHYTKYELQSIWQRRYDQNTLTLRLNGQYASDALISAEQFYLGGLYSVKGYRESLLNGDRGFYFSSELAIPAAGQNAWLLFFDCGRVGGDSALLETALYSLGVGYRWNFGAQSSAVVYAGAPLRRTVLGERADAVRVHAMASIAL